ncbi:MAG TPA: DUF2157 domain-containing protein [Thermoanaerobaculia bacterium]|nr:DUF2157 domain-containing protein [Thermoanaerobaculia bacterium]
MLSFARELEALREAGEVDPQRASFLLRIERLELMSVHYEIRLAAWLSVAAIATAVGAILRKNLDRIGPLAVAFVIAAAAGALYAWAFVRKRRGTAGVLDDYLAFLAALLVSADTGYVEQQFDLLGPHGFDHLAILAVVHAAFAYALRSKLILSLALAALAGWFGVDRTAAAMFDTSAEIGIRALLCAGFVVIWFLLHRRLTPFRGLDATFEHFAANLFGIGAVALAADDVHQWSGLALVVIFAAAAGTLAVRRRSELFLLYALAYGIAGVSSAVARHLKEEVLLTLYSLAVFAGAIVALFVAHLRWRFDE